MLSCGHTCLRVFQWPEKQLLGETRRGTPALPRVGQCHSGRWWAEQRNSCKHLNREESDLRWYPSWRLMFRDRGRILGASGRGAGWMWRISNYVRTKNFTIPKEAILGQGEVIWIRLAEPSSAQHQWPVLGKPSRRLWRLKWRWAEVLLDCGQLSGTQPPVE